MKKEGLIFNTYTNMFWLLMIMPFPIMLILNCISPSLYMIEGVFSITRVYEVYIDLITPVGTIVLGITATLQNKRLQKLEERADARETGCNIYIENNDYPADNFLSNEYAPFGYKKSEEYISLIFTNYSDVFLKAIEISFGEHKLYSSITLAKGRDKAFNIYLPEDKKSYIDQKCKITFISSLDVKTYGDFKIVDDDEDYEPRDIKHYHFYGTKQPK